ncbi:MAG: hypothetical protein U0892_03015 [Pirellulales bacterium]
MELLPEMTLRALTSNRLASYPSDPFDIDTVSTVAERNTSPAVSGPMRLPAMTLLSVPLSVSTIACIAADKYPRACD